MSRESVLPMWSADAQARRALPDAHLVDLFVLLHWMLFTNIELDNFAPILARFIERLEIEGAEERKWIMMAVVNVCAVLEKAGGVGTRDTSGASDAAMRVMAKRASAAKEDKDKMDVDDYGAPHQTSAAISEAEPDAQQPAAFRLALQLLFAMLTHALRRPTRKPSPFARASLNPYLTVVLTFLATVPLAGDWCLRGMEWVGRKVYQHGFWETGEEERAEIEVLDDSEATEITDGHIEDDNEEEEGGDGETARRWAWIVRCAVGITVVDCFTWVEGMREWRVEGAFAQKAEVGGRRIVSRRRREDERRHRMGTRWADDSMDVDDLADNGLSEESEDEKDQRNSGVGSLQSKSVSNPEYSMTSQNTPIIPPCLTRELPGKLAGACALKPEKGSLDELSEVLDDALTLATAASLNRGGSEADGRCCKPLLDADPGCGVRVGAAGGERGAWGAARAWGGWRGVGWGESAEGQGVGGGGGGRDAESEEGWQLGFRVGCVKDAEVEVHAEVTGGGRGAWGAARAWGGRRGVGWGGAPRKRSFGRAWICLPHAQLPVQHLGKLAHDAAHVGLAEDARAEGVMHVLEGMKAPTQTCSRVMERWGARAGSVDEGDKDGGGGDFGVMEDGGDEGREGGVVRRVDARRGGVR
ncbi:hypothetical protein B0H11DRAFT_2348588 [Mycena galericulata]|nr:hypothetical protein B0H11DRAFT_2348588 [Mycena galericulata]